MLQAILKIIKLQIGHCVQHFSSAYPYGGKQSDDGRHHSSKYHRLLWPMDVPCLQYPFQKVYQCIDTPLRNEAFVLSISNRLKNQPNLMKVSTMLQILYYNICIQEQSHTIYFSRRYSSTNSFAVFPLSVTSRLNSSSASNASGSQNDALLPFFCDKSSKCCCMVRISQMVSFFPKRLISDTMALCRILYAASL